MTSRTIRDAPPEERELILQFWNLRALFDQQGVMALDFDKAIEAMKHIQEQRDELRKQQIQGDASELRR